MSLRPLLAPILVARYVALRSAVARAYTDVPLDVLLARIDDSPRLAQCEASDLAVAVQVAERLAFLIDGPNTCLFRALARYALARSVGLEPVLVVAVGHALDSPGHAWIELDRVPYLEPDDPAPRFIPVLVHPTGARSPAKGARRGSGDRPARRD